ncbi:MAG TPA: toll/interleukin-1 receptor domain-containing protein [Thermoanaerobaculia bacterium]|nr:toll/interleukin-1 receptor domain-containing protein [Thermoanaerobaculia bacterium]
MTERARIFISHSAADQEAGDAVNVHAHDVRVAVRDKLDPQFHVLIDEVELKAGDVWRARINLWLGLCDAAVLVLSPAALKSHYVAFEANILGYRWAMDNSFRIIPVLVGVTMDQVKNSPLNPAQVSEWQSAISGTPDEVADSVLQALAGVVVSKSRPIDALATAMKSFLPADENSLDAAAQALAVAELPWTIDAKTFRLALRLLGSGMVDECARAIRYLRDAPDFKEEVSLQRIKELIACAWVDMKAKDIPMNACEAEPRPMLLNAMDRTIAEIYMTAAKYRKQPYLRYKLIETAVVVDEKWTREQHEQFVLAKVREDLEKALGKTGEKLAVALENYHRLEEPVVVLLREHSLTPALLPKLRNDFKHVTFFVLGGATAGSTVNQGGDLFVVRPPLDTTNDEENLFLKNRDAFFELIHLGD